MDAVAPNVPISARARTSGNGGSRFINADIPQKKIVSFQTTRFTARGRRPEELADHRQRDHPADARACSTTTSGPPSLARPQGLNPASGERHRGVPGSTETFRTHASPLWTADYADNAAELGMTWIGFHSSTLDLQGRSALSATAAAAPT